MKAMILAAGLGTRLKPLTDSKPKALVEIGGVPMLEIVIRNLKRQGFNRIVVNVHHLGNQIIDFLRERDFGVEIKISDERGKLLYTGGGIVNAARLLFGEDRSPVLIHNVDILSNADLSKLIANQISLLVSERVSSRKLIFDEDLSLKGWHNLVTDEIRPEGLIRKKGWRELAFSGIYSITLKAVEEMESIFGVEAFPVMDYFLNPLRREKIMGLEEPQLRIIDIGKPATLAQAQEFSL